MWIEHPNEFVLRLSHTPIPKALPDVTEKYFWYARGMDQLLQDTNTIESILLSFVREVYLQSRCEMLNLLYFRETKKHLFDKSFIWGIASAS